MFPELINFVLHFRAHCGRLRNCRCCHAFHILRQLIKGESSQRQNAIPNVFVTAGESLAQVTELAQR
jgi:hypothetical protein